MAETDFIVSVVCPLSNDEDIVDAYIEDVLGVLRANYTFYELVLVDDGSTDGTVDRVRQSLQRNESIRVVPLSRSFGQEIAISAGLDSAIGDYVTVMLPDTDPPDLITGMVDRARAGAGIVFGIRRNVGADGWTRQAGSALFYWCCNRLLDLQIPRNTTHFRVLSRQAVNALTQIKDRARYLRTLSAFVGYQRQSFEYDTIQRRAVPRRKTLPQSVRLAVDIVLANSTHPLRLVSVAGLIVSLLNLAYMAYIAVVYVMKDDVAEGWVTQSAQSAVMFFFLFLMLTVLCEYVGRLLEEVKSRPLYHLMDEMNSAVLLDEDRRRNVVTESEEEARPQ